MSPISIGSAALPSFLVYYSKGVLHWQPVGSAENYDINYKGGPRQGNIT